jgi:hypothetical protein
VINNTVLSGFMLCSFVLSLHVVCVLRHEVHAVIGEGPHRPSLKCSSWAIGPLEIIWRLSGCVMLFDFAIITFSMLHHNDHYLYPRGPLYERPLDDSQALKHDNL